jgi:heat shock protein HtpX
VLGTTTRQRWRNGVQTALLLGGMAVVLTLLAWLVLGPVGLVLVVGLGVLVVAVRPRTRAAWTLRMYGAQPLPERAAPQLHAAVRVLAARSGLPRPPALFYVASPIVNAFSLGHRDDAALALSDGLLRRLTPRQVVAVLAHEIGHVRAGDTTIMNLSDSIGRLVHGLSYAGILTLLLTGPLTVAGRDVRPLTVSAVLVALPTLITLLQLALSRAREYDADLDAATLTGDPEGLASALIALDAVEGRIWERTMVGRSRAPDLFLLRTHPPTAERVRRLRSLTSRPSPGDGRPLGHDVPAPPVPYPTVAGPARLRAPGIRW